MGTGLLPLNFACNVEPGFSIGSDYVASPEAPLTPNERFYVNCNYGVPEAPRSWKLFIEGMVDRPTSHTLKGLSRFADHTVETTLECIGNSPGGTLMSAGAFTGVRLSDVLDDARLSPRSRGLRFLGLDGYPAYLPATIAHRDDVLLVHTLNERPLPLWNGAPLRLLVPGRYGMFNIKWLDAITATRDYASYGSLGELANFIAGETRTRSRVDTIANGDQRVAGETTELLGVAVTPGLGVTRVEVDTGSGWQSAEIVFDPVRDDRSPFLWTLWRLLWTPTSPGTHQIRVRAWDGQGNTQDLSSEFPYDGSAIHRVFVHVVG